MGIEYMGIYFIICLYVVEEKQNCYFRVRSYNNQCGSYLLYVFFQYLKRGEFKLRYVFSVKFILDFKDLV